ncbi:MULTISPECIES: hypothetical protein [unclassified Streptomyces]|uniref:hypothetical protein n=1 Tax=unclassified Streptomyces TaxID=2593676 RepID=UPI00070175FA|nr:MULTISPECIES: hypothetical protein [unclassified Streptomyces]KQX49769.1 hypothetical protein ASD33_13975 [Streptomyces sp. Root1304]KRA80186.1 hypothetical protein ASE09_18935 [Streptomyces sp. Root66D1]
MSEPEFTARGVRIARWPRSLTRAGEVRIEDGRLALLTSYGSEIDSAPVDAVRAGRPWFAKPDEAVATVNGTRYRLTLHKERGRGAEEARQDTSEESGRFLAALKRAAGRR